MRVLIAFVLLVAATTAIGAYRLHHEAKHWTPDAAIYLRMALADRGMSPAEARSTADAFMLTTTEADTPESRGYYGPKPPPFYVRQFALFVTRPLYPRIAALLYPRFGPRALQLVSVAAFICATAVMFAVLLAFVPPWLAALGALAFATAPMVLDVSAAALTDALATLFWVAALGAILSYVRRPSALTLALVAAASLALTFTRPAAYLPVGAAVGALVAFRRSPDRRAALALLGATVGVLVVFVLYTRLVHGPGLAEQFRWQYEWRQAVDPAVATQSPATWYLHVELAAIALLVTVAIYKYSALLPMALAAFGALIVRPRAQVAVLVGALVASIAALIVNPSTEFNRSVELPVTPIVVLLATCALGALARAAGGGATTDPLVPRGSRNIT